MLITVYAAFARVHTGTGTCIQGRFDLCCVVALASILLMNSFFLNDHNCLESTGIFLVITLPCTLPTGSVGLIKYILKSNFCFFN